MKLFMLALAAAGTFTFSAQAFAEDGKLLALADATQKDYDTLKTSFREARQTGSREKYQRKLDAVTARVTARRRTLRDLGEGAANTLPAGKAGLARMLIGDLDRLNISILALASGERGHAGYFRSRDGGLISGISEWQEGIRQGLIQTRRSIKLARSIMGPLTMAAGFSLLPAH